MAGETFQADILLRSGLESELLAEPGQSKLRKAEPAVTLDTKKVLIGDGNGNAFVFTDNTFITNALATKLDASQKGASGGIASLDTSGYLTSAQVPPIGAICTTAAGTAAKTLNLYPTYTAPAGMNGRQLLCIQFTNGNTANNPTLNISGTGAKPIYYDGSPVTPGMIPAGHLAVLLYKADVVSTGAYYLLNPYVQDLTAQLTALSRKDGQMVNVSTAVETFLDVPMVDAFGATYTPNFFYLTFRPSPTSSTVVLTVNGSDYCNIPNPSGGQWVVRTYFCMVSVSGATMLN